ncbi:MAG TPA: SRPBCC family protein [Gemmatimonadaceae bacterium]|nr:SRPBCC family protein [Gemmatimonadaceae bacterium]
MTTTTPTPTPTSASGDRIEEQVLLQAPRARVWRALTTAEELGAWFGAKLAGATIAPGAQVVGPIALPGYEHLTFDAIIVEMVPEQRFAWRWHPHAIDPAVDYTAEPRTLVTFTLEDAPGGGTLLRVVESGFDAIPAARRMPAFLGNASGWRGQLQKRLPAYLVSA